MQHTHNHNHTPPHTHAHKQAKDKVLVGREEAERLVVTKDDFEHALQFDIKPAFGISDEQLDRYVFNGVWCM